MTDTPTPPMTPEQRAHFCRLLNNAGLGECADQLEADGVTIATITAECDAAQAEIARLTAALATAREDGMREVKEIKPTQAQIDDACLSYRHDYGLMTPANRALMRFEATEWLLAWGKTITKGAAI